MTQLFVDMLFLSGAIMIATCTVVVFLVAYDFIKNILK